MATYLHQIQLAHEAAAFALDHLRQAQAADAKPIEKAMLGHLTQRAAELHADLYALVAALEDSQ